MRLEHDVAWADSRNVRIDTISSKNIESNFQNVLLKKLLAQLGDQTDIFWKFYLPAEHGCPQLSGEC